MSGGRSEVAFSALGKGCQGILRNSMDHYMYVIIDFIL